MARNKTHRAKVQFGLLGHLHERHVVKGLLRGKRASATAGTATKPARTPRSLVCTTRQIKVAPEPFAHGNVRFARWGRIMDAGPDDPWRPYIFKVRFSGKNALLLYYVLAMARSDSLDLVITNGIQLI